MTRNSFTRLQVGYEAGIKQRQVNPKVKAPSFHWIKMNFKNLKEDDADVREPQSKEEVKTNTRKIKQDK